MCEPSTLLPLKCGPEPWGWGWGRGHGVWSAAAVVRLESLGQVTFLLWASFPISSVMG